MPVLAAENSTMAEQSRLRKPRNPPHLTATNANPETDPNYTRSKHTISSLLLYSSPNNDTNSKKKNFPSATFRGLGCTTSSQVSVPAVIRTSANWEAKKMKKKRFKTKKSSDNKLPSNSSNSNPLVTNNGNPVLQSSLSLALSSSCVGMPTDVWCGPGIGLSTDAASVDCVVSRRPATRGKVDGRTCAPRRMVTPEDLPFFETDSSIRMSNFHADISSSRHNRHVRHGFREGLAEIVMLQSDLLMGVGFEGMDGYRDLRLDIDNMTYEELLELGDRIGHVSTGLTADVMTRCLRRSKIAGNLSSLLATEMEKKCSICQEEYEQDDETGRLLNCGHAYHIECIKQWLLQKNICPICKTEALPQNQN